MTSGEAAGIKEQGRNLSTPEMLPVSKLLPSLQSGPPPEASDSSDLEARSTTGSAAGSVQEWRSQTLEAMRRAGAGWHDDDSGCVTVTDTVRSSSWQSAATGSGTDRDSLATTPYAGGSMECTETARRTSVGSKSMESGTASSLSSGPAENGNAVMQHAPPPVTGVIASDLQDTVPVPPFDDATGHQNQPIKPNLLKIRAPRAPLADERHVKDSLPLIPEQPGDAGSPAAGTPATAQSMRSVHSAARLSPAATPTPSITIKTPSSSARRDFQVFNPFAAEEGPLESSQPGSPQAAHDSTSQEDTFWDTRPLSPQSDITLCDMAQQSCRLESMTFEMDREDSIDMIAAKRHNSGHLDFGAHGRTGSGVVGPRLEHYDSGRRADKFAVQEGEDAEIKQLMWVAENLQEELAGANAARARAEGVISLRRSEVDGLEEQCRGIVDEASALDEELAAVHSRLEQQLLTKLEQEEQIRHMAEELKVVQAEVATLDTWLRERDEKMAELRTLSRQSPRPGAAEEEDGAGESPRSHVSSPWETSESESEAPAATTPNSATRRSVSNISEDNQAKMTEKGGTGGTWLARLGGAVPSFRSTKDLPPTEELRQEASYGPGDPTANPKPPMGGGSSHMDFPRIAPEYEPAEKEVEKEVEAPSAGEATDASSDELPIFRNY